MTTTRSRDGTLPSRTFEAVMTGMRNLDRPIVANGSLKSRSGSGSGHSHRRVGRPRKDELKHTDTAGTTGSQFICRLKVPNYKDELDRIIGTDAEPYYGLFEGNAEAASTDHTQPTAEDRALCSALSRGSMEKSKHQEAAAASKLSIHFAQKYAMDAWYRGAYPAEYTRRDYLAVCGYCLHYMTSDLAAERHSVKCRRRVPPGREIYRDGNLSMWEVDGLYSSLYCQNLCMLAKSFLASKSLYIDVQPFLFYVLTQTDEGGAQFLGYFSKQKMYAGFRPAQPIQCVSCIMSLPFAQNKGCGQFLIDFSYLLAREQQATGSPETPLSELGEIAFRKYWEMKVCCAVKDFVDSHKPFSIASLSRETGIVTNHVILALEDLGWLAPDGSKQPNLTIRVNRKRMEQVAARWNRPGAVRVDPTKLVWAPYTD